MQIEKMFNSKRLTLLLTLFILFSNLPIYALPTDETYWDRVSSGLEKLSLSEEEIAEIEPLMRRVIQTERAHHPEYYQVVTAQNSGFLAYQIILKEFYSLIHRQSFEEFEFLRPYKDPKLHTDVWEFLSEHPDLINSEKIEKQYLHLKEGWKHLSEDERDDKEEAFWKTIENDTLPDIRRQIVAASLTMETSTPLDSALFVLSYGAGLSQDPDLDFLKKELLYAFSLEGISHSATEKILQNLLEKAPTSERGIILQIFVPKEEASPLMYISYGIGFVKTKETEEMETYFRNHELKRESDEFDRKKNDQVRILVGALEPGKVKVFRYSCIDPHVIQTYKNLVRSKLKSLISYDV